ncbi:hypothetical protein SynMVIR181_02615 [Synechococcus sp. MVIR-18-1]|nr:hypothetical protein SynMVIR181_02615 [Synechococcus sp. MVIR-18-1]
MYIVTKASLESALSLSLYSKALCPESLMQFFALNIEQSSCH